MRWTGKPISIRWGLLRSFIILILISSVTVLVLMSIRAQRTERNLSEQLISKGMLHGVRELDRFFQPANAGTQMAVQWGRAGKLDLTGVINAGAGSTTQLQIEAVAGINSLLLPYILFHPEISSVQIANSRGDGFLILQLKSGRIVNRVVSRDTWGDQTLWFDVDKDGQPVSLEWKKVDYDPRKRAWYRGAENSPYGMIHWTDPNIFFTTRDLGITSSAKWRYNGMEYFVAYDVLLSAVTAFTQSESRRISPNAQMVIVTDDRRAVGLPPHELFNDDESIRNGFLMSMDKFPSSEIKDALGKLAGLKHKGKNIFNFTSNGTDWWVGVQAYPLGKHRNLWIGVLVPNKDLLEGITVLRIYLLVATLIALGAALVYSLLLARSYSQPLEALAAQSHRIRDLDFRSDEKIEARFSEFKQLGEAQEQSLKALQSFSRYVPIELVQELVLHGEVAKIGGKTKLLTILFTDIEGFTKIAESMEPEILANHMAGYFQTMIDILHNHGATVDKLVGDSVVAFWGAPSPIEDREQKATDAVLACRDELERLNRKWAKGSNPTLPTRFGLATGPAVVGNIGAVTRLSYTVLGDTVNLASRLEGLNKLYGTKILMDENTRNECSDLFEWRQIDRIVVMGRTKTTDIFEVLGKTGKVREEKIIAARMYETAWQSYSAGNFEQALKILEKLEKEFGEDRAVYQLGKKCEEYGKNPPPEGWHGATVMLHK